MINWKKKVQEFEEFPIFSLIHLMKDYLKLYHLFHHNKIVVVVIKNVKNTLKNHETMFQKWLSNPNVITFFEWYTVYH